MSVPLFHPASYTFLTKHNRNTLVPELRIYKIWDGNHSHPTSSPPAYINTNLPSITEPVGPHTLAMFEVDILTPVHFGAFVPWLVINRGPLSVLLHPNTDDPLRDHTQRATWLGKEVPVDVGLLRKLLGKAKQ